MPRVSLLVPDMPARDELLPYLDRIDHARWYTNFGPLVTELEAALAARHPAPDGALPHAVTVANATLGIQLALEALTLEAGARVLVPGFTFPATITAVIRAGLSPVVCDVEETSWMLTPNIARRAIGSERIDAIVPVATFGGVQDCAAWDDVVLDSGIPVIIDAAGAFGNQRVGQRAHVVFSLHATKTLGAGEGGVLLTHDLEIASRVRKLSNFGIDVGTGAVLTPGTNAKLSEYHAAIALAALARWKSRARVRVEMHLRYLADLQAQCPELGHQARPGDGVYSICSVLLPSNRRAADAMPYLASRGIESRRWYWPTVLEHPAFRGVPMAGPLEVVQMLGERLIGLPFHPYLNRDDEKFVSDALRSFLDH